MILELDSSLFDIGKISINQLVFLTLCLNDIKANNQDVHQFLSRIDETEIQSLIDQNLIIRETCDNDTIYKPSKHLLELTTPSKTMFDELYEEFPVYVTRPDGTKGFLRANINKCRKEYNHIIGKSKAMHEHIMNCLRFEIDNKTVTGKLGYMKTMWKWLTQREWEVSEEAMQTELKESEALDYGTVVI